MLPQTITAAPDQYQKLIDNYSAILEKTNNQLGVGINLSSLSVAILSVLIAVIGIAVAYYLWKNSQDQRKLVNDFLISAQERIDKQAVIFLEQEKKRIDNFIKELEGANKSSTEEEKKKIQKIIDEYKQEKEDLSRSSLQPSDNFIYTGVNFNPSSLSAPFVARHSAWIPSNQGRRLTCMNCGRSFSHNDEFSAVGVGLGGGKTYCSYCGSGNVF